MKKGMSADTPTSKGMYHAECIRYSRFYLEQFFNYLTLSLSNEARQSTSHSSNEEKIKEMWEKLCYSLTRSETNEMLALV